MENGFPAAFSLVPSLPLFCVSPLVLADNARRRLMTERSERMSEEASCHLSVHKAAYARISISCGAGFFRQNDTRSRLFLP